MVMTTTKMMIRCDDGGDGDDDDDGGGGGSRASQNPIRPIRRTRAADLGSTLSMFKKVADTKFSY